MFRPIIRAHGGFLRRGAGSRYSERITRLARHFGVAALAALLLGTIGCTATAPDPSPSDTASPSPLTIPSTAPTPTPSADAGSTPGSTAEEFSAAQLAEACVGATQSTYAEDVVFDAPGARIEERTVEPRWLVIVPTSTGGYDGESRCTIGGTPDEPVIEMSEGSIRRLDEAAIQDLIHGRNEGGTD